jgi:hypothetical protein
MKTGVRYEGTLGISDIDSGDGMQGDGGVGMRGGGGDTNYFLL